MKGYSDVWYMLHDQERYVYHYTPAKTLAHHILQTAKLRFSRFQAVNDPRENRNWVFNYSGRSALLDFDSALVAGRINEVLKHSWRIGCFVVDPYEALITPARENLGEDIVSAIYERGHSRPAMWAHYGDNHAGACLVFDKAKLDTEIRQSRNTVYANKVDYRYSRVMARIGGSDYLTISMRDVDRAGFREGLDRHINEHLVELFFTKGPDWQQEREYRWVVMGDDDDDYFVGITQALVGIALGERFPNCHKLAVAKYAEAHDVSLATMTWQNGVPQPRPTHWRLVAESVSS